MTFTPVWVEEPGDGGSAVWGCDSCDHGAWCWDYAAAREEATKHAIGHGVLIKVLRAHHGPHANPERDNRIWTLRHKDALSIRAIATIVGLSNSGVIKALRRLAKAGTR